MTDALTVLSFLFTFGPEPTSLDGADANDDGALGLPDPLLMLNYLFTGGVPPALPFPEVGIDPTPDELVSGCGSVSLGLSVADSVFESDSAIVVAIHGVGVVAESHAVFRDGVLDPDLVVATLSERFVDQDQDGISEEYFAEILIDFGAAGLSGTRTVRILTTGFDGLGNAIVEHLDVTVRRHLTIHMPQPAVATTFGVLIRWTSTFTASPLLMVFLCKSLGMVRTLRIKC